MKRRSYRQLTRQRGEGIEKLLGELEAEIMDLLWAEDGVVMVRDVLTKLNRKRERPIAYTTVMTIMARLTEKGLLQRTLVGKTHEYRVAQTREEFLRRASGRIVEDLLADFGEVAIAGFVEALGRVDPRRLQELRRYLDAEIRPR
jgi:predicted transcriptional regulator